MGFQSRVKVQQVSRQVQHLQTARVLEQARLDELDLVGVEVQMMDGGERWKLPVREVLQEVSRQIEEVDGGRQSCRDPSEVQTAAVDILVDLQPTRMSAISQQYLPHCKKLFSYLVFLHCFLV